MVKKIQNATDIKDIKTAMVENGVKMAKGKEGLST